MASGRAGEADRGVAVGAAARRDVQVGRVAVRRVRGEALDAVGVQVAVGDEGAVEGDAELAAVGVAGQDQGVAVGGEGVQDAQVRGVDDGQREVGVRLDGPPATSRVAVALDVRVVQAGQRRPPRRRASGGPGCWSGSPSPPRRRRRAGPPTGCGRRRRPGGLPFRPCRPLGLLDQVAGGVAQLGAVVVVGAEDVRARELHQRAERVEDLGHALRVGEVVARC